MKHKLKIAKHAHDHGRPKATAMTIEMLSSYVSEVCRIKRLCFSHLSFPKLYRTAAACYILMYNIDYQIIIHEG